MKIGSKSTAVTLSDRLLHNPGAEGVGAADLKHMLAAGQHPGDEFVAGKREQRTLGVLVPGLVDHQSKARNPVLFLDVEKQGILWFLGGRAIVHGHTGDAAAVPAAHLFLLAALD